jgi:hypothetical protein
MSYALDQAQTALRCALRGDWPSSGYSPHELHPELSSYGTVYACSQLVGRSEADVDLALQAVTELVIVVRELQNQLANTRQLRRDTQEDVEALQEERRELLRDLRGDLDINLDEDDDNMTVVNAIQRALFVRRPIYHHRSTTFREHLPDPWESYDADERSAIEHEPPSRWTLLRRPWPARDDAEGAP